jgi:uncharacterized membrane-anchored protein YhcB (DUF1043 family)
VWGLVGVAIGFLFMRIINHFERKRFRKERLRLGGEIRQRVEDELNAALRKMREEARHEE